MSTSDAPPDGGSPSVEAFSSAMAMVGSSGTIGACEAARRGRAGWEPVRRPLAGLRALVVEDEYFIADDLKRILKRHGAEGVVLSGTIADAARRIRDGGFEVALLDLNIRSEMVFPLADALARSGTPFAFVSGCSPSVVPPRFASVPLWAKPCDERTLVEGIRRLRPRLERS